MEDHFFTGGERAEMDGQANGQENVQGVRTVQDKVYKPKWYLSYPVLIASLVFCFPISVILSILRVWEHDKQTGGYRIRSFLAVGVNMLLVLVIGSSIFTADDWRDDYDRCIEEDDYAAARDILDAHYSDGMTVQGIELYLGLFGASGDHEGLDQVILDYYEGLEDKTQFDDGVMQAIEAVTDRLDQEQRKVVEGILLDVRGAIAEAKALEESASAEAKEQEQAEAARIASEGAEEEREEIREIIGAYLEDPKKRYLEELQEKDSALVWDILKEEYIRDTVAKIDMYPNTTGPELRRYCEMYQEAFPEIDGDAERTLEDIQTIDRLDGSIQDIKRRYGFELSTAVEAVGTYEWYVQNRLETQYEDTIAGAISKEIDNLQKTNESDWVAYNVEYLWGTAMPGDNAVVLHSKELNPFSRSGAYTLSCILTPEKKTLVDSSGFRWEAPVYELITDMGALIDDRDRVVDAEGQIEQLWGQIEQRLGGPMGQSASNGGDTASAREGAAPDKEVISSDSSYILPESDKRYLSTEDLAGLDQATLRLARNEIYARHGRKFQTEDLNAYFSQQPWYRGYLTEGQFDDSVFNVYEKANLELIKSLEASATGGSPQDITYGTGYDGYTGLVTIADVIDTQWAMTPNEEYSFWIVEEENGTKFNDQVVYMIETGHPENVLYRGYVQQVTGTELADLYITVGRGGTAELALVWRSLELIDYPEVETIGGGTSAFAGGYHYLGKIY